MLNARTTEACFRRTGIGRGLIARQREAKNAKHFELAPPVVHCTGREAHLRMRTARSPLHRSHIPYPHFLLYMLKYICYFTPQNFTKQHGLQANQ